MNKKEEFKEFVKDRPFLANSVKEGKTTFQKLYELYDIYGNNEEIFNEYKGEKNLSNILSSIKNINMDEIKNNIESLQNAVNFIEEFIVPEKKEEKIVEAVVNPKPLEGLFDD